MRMSLTSPSKIMEARKHGDDTCRILKEKKCHTNILYLAKHWMASPIQ